MLLLLFTATFPPFPLTITLCKLTGNEAVSRDLVGIIGYMNERLTYVDWYPINSSDLGKYLRKIHPPLSSDKLVATIYSGTERRILRTPTIGDTTVTIFYKQKEGYLLGMDTATEDLNVLQVQGGSQEGYRVMTGLDCLGFSADELLRIATHPESPFRRITMPNIQSITGILDASTNACLKYSALAHRSGLVFSSEEGLYVRDIPNRKFSHATLKVAQRAFPKL